MKSIFQAIGIERKKVKVKDAKGSPQKYMFFMTSLKTVFESLQKP